MKVKNIKEILNDNELSEDYQKELKSKLTLNWNEVALISVYDIAFMLHFNLIGIVVFYNKLKTVKHPDRYDGIIKAKNSIAKVFGSRGLRSINIELEELINSIKQEPSKRKISKAIKLLKDITSESKSTVSYKETLESELESVISDGLGISPSYISVGKDNIDTNHDYDIELIDIQTKLVEKLTRASAITHHLELHDLLSYDYLDFKNNIKNKIIPSKKDIHDLLLSGGTKEKNAKEIAATITTLYKKLQKEQYF